MKPPSSALALFDHDRFAKVFPPAAGVFVSYNKLPLLHNVVCFCHYTSLIVIAREPSRLHEWLFFKTTYPWVFVSLYCCPVRHSDFVPVVMRISTLPKGFIKHKHHFISKWKRSVHSSICTPFLFVIPKPCILTPALCIGWTAPTPPHTKYTVFVEHFQTGLGRIPPADRSRHH